MIERVFGWLFVALGLMGLVGVAMGAWWQWLMVGGCVVMAWSCFSEAREEGTKKA